MKRSRKRRKRKRKKTRKKRKIASRWISDKCAPRKKGHKKQTCYSNQSLFKIRDIWNMRHPDVRIDSNKPDKIWNFLKFYMKDECKRESCWIKQTFIKDKLNAELKHFTFAPMPPKSWKKKPREWLTSVDILKVMRQYEKIHPDFYFIGPSPINYDEHIAHGECVWEELCKFNLEKQIKRGKYKIGIIFNTDPHYKEGSHWVALYIDIKKGEIYYFDSYGERDFKVY